MIRIKSKGDFKKVNSFFERLKEFGKRGELDKYGQAGVNALMNATPKDTGETAASWTYEIVRQNGKTSVVWKNSNRNDGVLIAIILQYGHATGNGGYVEGVDYINPAMRHIFDNMANDMWKEATKS